MPAPPECRKCGKLHFNFHPCGTDSAQRKRGPFVLRQPLPEGWQPWGDRFHTLERRGESTFVKPREAPLRGRLTYPAKEE